MTVVGDTHRAYLTPDIKNGADSTTSAEGTEREMHARVRSCDITRREREGPREVGKNEKAMEREHRYHHDPRDLPPQHTSVATTNYRSSYAGRHVAKVDDQDLVRANLASRPANAAPLPYHCHYLMKAFLFAQQGTAGK